MHGNDPLVITTSELVCAKNILGIVITDLQQALIFALLGLFGVNTLSDLNIKFLVLPGCNEVNLAISGLADIDRISTAAQFKVYDIFQTACNSIIIITENAITERCIRKIEFLLCFQNLLAIEVIPGTPMQQVSLLQLFKIAIYSFVVERSALCALLSGSRISTWQRRCCQRY